MEHFPLAITSVTAGGAVTTRAGASMSKAPPAATELGISKITPLWGDRAFPLCSTTYLPQYVTANLTVVLLIFCLSTNDKHP